MMKRILYSFCFVVAWLALVAPVFGQDDTLEVPATNEAQAIDGNKLHFYGYMQSLFYYQHQHYDVDVDRVVNGAPKIDKDANTASFALQQMNLFLNKPFEERFTAFVNFEFQASYSTERNWGDFNIQEAWVNYAKSDAFNLKAGLLLPTFNNLNEIQNRLPLFPYIFRPAVYEVLISGLFNFEDYRPQQAFLQTNGFLPLGDNLRGDYAFHVGNSEESYSSKTPPASGMRNGGAINIFRGEDLVWFKAVGGRVGVRTSNETFKAGVSSTYDKDNRREVNKSSMGGLPGIETPVLGDVDRYRVGADLSFTLGKFGFESEYIRVMHSGLPKGATLDKTFYYGGLVFNGTESWFTHVMYSFMNNQAFSAAVPDTTPDEAGVHFSSLGTGYRINPVATLKLEYLYGRMGNNPYMGLRNHYALVGFSLLF